MKINKRQDPVFSLWILITLSMAIFLAISFTDGLRLGTFELTKPKFKEVLMAGNEKKEPATIPADTLPEVVMETLVPPDTTIRKILIFGDSMTHNLAMSIAKYGSKNNYKVTSVTWESSSILAWANSDKIATYMNEVKPDFVIISLGSNEMELKHFDTRAKYVGKILEKIDTLPFIWIGPPLWKEDKGLYKMLSDEISKDKLFKIENMEIDRGPDHVHPTRKGADQWADTLMRWQLRGSHPIPAELPDSDSTIKGHRFIYLHPDD